jgi:hypothetical protein
MVKQQHNTTAHKSPFMNARACINLEKMKQKLGMIETKSKLSVSPFVLFIRGVSVHHTHTHTGLVSHALERQQRRTPWRYSQRSNARMARRCK